MFPPVGHQALAAVLVATVCSQGKREFSQTYRAVVTWLAAILLVYDVIYTVQTGVAVRGAGARWWRRAVGSDVVTTFEVLSGSDEVLGAVSEHAVGAGRPPSHGGHLVVAL